MIALKNFLVFDHSRSALLRKNITLGFLLKLVNVGIQIVFVPVLLDFLSPLKYGIWLTITSTINWFYYFDGGVENGLRNKLAEAVAKNDFTEAKQLVSTGYFTVFISAAILFFCFLVINQFLNWEVIFNTPGNIKSEIDAVMVIVFAFFSLNFSFRLISAVQNAFQRSAQNEIIYTAGSILSLLFIIICKQYFQGSLIWFALSVNLGALLPVAAVTGILFKTRYKLIKPNFGYFKFSSLKKISSLGYKFFIMQLAAVVLFTTDNVIITQLFGPEKVAPYNIALKYFSIIQIAFSIILTPMWSAYTEAYIKKDFIWIQRKIKQIIYIWAALTVFVFIMVIFSDLVFKTWLGNRIHIPFELTVAMAVFIIISTWNNIFTFFINGIGKLKISLVTSIVNMIINIPLSIYLAKYLDLGVIGVIMATCFCLLIGAVLRPVQYLKIINNKAQGAWGQ